MNKVSVLMSVYHEKENYLRTAIESVLNQTYTNIEFIIVNDAPGDAAVESILAEYAGKDRRIVLVSNEQNMGLDRSLNHGLEFVTGDFIARMDSNDYSYPNRIERELAFLNENGYDLVSCFINIMNAQGTVTYYAKPFIYPEKLLLETLMHFDCVAHAAWLAKRSVYEKLNGYRHIRAAEDYDFVLRTLENGFSIGIIDAVLFDCRELTDGISGSYKMEQFLTTRFFSKHKNRVSSIPVEAFAEYTKSRITPESRERFNKCRHEFYLAAKAGGLRKILHIIKAIFASRYSLALLRRIMYERKYKRAVAKLQKQSYK